MHIWKRLKCFYDLILYWQQCMKLEFVVVRAKKTASFQPGVDSCQNRWACTGDIAPCKSLGKSNLAHLAHPTKIDTDSTCDTNWYFWRQSNNMVSIVSLIPTTYWCCSSMNAGVLLLVLVKWLLSKEKIFSEYLLMTWNVYIISQWHKCQVEFQCGVRPPMMLLLMHVPVLSVNGGIPWSEYLG